jgi:hypothetical protein
MASASFPTEPPSTLATLRLRSLAQTVLSPGMTMQVRPTLDARCITDIAVGLWHWYSNLSACLAGAEIPTPAPQPTTGLSSASRRRSFCGQGKVMCGDKCVNTLTSLESYVSRSRTLTDYSDAEVVLARVALTALHWEMSCGVSRANVWLVDSS